MAKQIVISCSSNRRKIAGRFPQAKVIQDKWDKKGALTGVLSSPPEIESEYVALVTCDCPKLSPKVIEFLFIEARGHDGAIPRWPIGYLEPLQSVYRTKSFHEAVKEIWKNNKMKLTYAIEKLPDLIYISTEKLKKLDPTLKTFLNVNSPDELKRL